MPRIADRVLAAVLAAALASVCWAGQEVQELQDPNLVLVKTLVVPAAAGGVDTGIDLAQGDEVLVKATGEITLQKGNPAASCGPAGIDIMTVQQPIPDRNIGALIGKVAQLISSKIDEDTGEEIRDEIVAYVFFGVENDVLAPIKGRLYLGVNETVIKDNAGEFTALIYRRKT